MTQVETESAAIRWAVQQLGGDCESQPLRREASLRCYYRLNQGQSSWILMDASAEVESAQSFLTVGEKLQGLGLRVPGVIASQSDQGWLLLEDFGQQRLLEVLQAEPESAAQWYPRAWAELLKLQASEGRDRALPVMDQAWARRESMRLLEDFVPALNFLAPPDKPGGVGSGPSPIEAAIDQLAEAVVAQPFCLSHRDFHAANLMCLPGDQVGILDFQSAFYAPMTYDIASLLRDCYIDWPAGQVMDWLAKFFHQAPLLQARYEGFEVFQRGFDEVSLQRHLKCLGLFVRLGQSGQPQYLDALPRTMRYVQQVCEKEARWQVFLPIIAAGQEVFP